jgi:hypothetical protein
MFQAAMQLPLSRAVTAMLNFLHLAKQSFLYLNGAERNLTTDRSACPASFAGEFSEANSALLNTLMLNCKFNNVPSGITNAA